MQEAAHLPETPPLPSADEGHVTWMESTRNQADALKEKIRRADEAVNSLEMKKKEILLRKEADKSALLALQCAMVRQQTEDAKGKVREARQHLARLSVTLAGIRSRKEEALNRNNRALATFHSLGVEALQCKMVALQSPHCESAKRNLADAEERVNQSSAEVERTVADLQASQKEEEDLKLMMDLAEESLKTEQVLLETVLIEFKKLPS